LGPPPAHRTWSGNFHWSVADVGSVLFDLAEARVATLLGATESADPEDITALRWPTSPPYNERDRIDLALAEQIVIDVNGATDTMIHDLHRRIGTARIDAFVVALWLIGATARASLVLGVAPRFEGGNS
jgi:hypothetical protein